MRVHVLTLIYTDSAEVHAQFADTSLLEVAWKLGRWIVKRNLELDDEIGHLGFAPGEDIEAAIQSWVQREYACCTAEVQTHCMAG